MANYQIKKERKGKQKKNIKKKKEKLINDLRETIFSPNNFINLITEVSLIECLENLTNEINKKEVKENDKKSNSNNL